MPDSTIYAETSGNGDDAYIGVISSSDWATARGDASTNGGIRSDSLSSYSIGVYNRKQAGRGGSNWYCYRSYFSFDVSGESGTVDSATIKLYLDNVGSTGPASAVKLVEATSLSGSTADFGNCFSSGSTLGRDMTGGFVSVSTTAGYHDFVLDSAGIGALNDQIGSGSLQVCLMGNAFDYLDNDPGAGSTYTRISVTYSEYTGTSRDPKIEIDYEAVAAATHNATFFGSNF
jgi:hypothetical protein